MMKKPSLLLLLLGFAGCASVHEGRIAESKGPDKIAGLVISAEELTDPGAESFSMVSVTFENKTEEWLRVDKVEVLIGEALADKVSIVVGQDLKDWVSAMEARGRMEQHNRAMAQLGLVAVGGVALAAAGRGDTGLALAGGVAVLGANAWMMTDIIKASHASATEAQTLPDNHVLRPFAIPGKMFLRRWLLINKPMGKRIASLPLAIHTVDGRSGIVEMNLKRSP
jgi:hypothetical protein